LKKRISMLLLLFSFLFTGLLSSCSQDNAILATSKLKNITKNDFLDWLGAKKIKKESILGSKDKQIALLESMALELFIMDKAEAEGIDRSGRYTALMEQTKESTLFSHFLAAITAQATYNEPTIRVSHIFLALNLYKTDPENKTRKIKLEHHEVMAGMAEMTSKAKDIIQKLDNGDSFKKLAKEFSSDSNKKSGGDLGYIVKGMMPAYFSEPAFNLKVGEYSKTPVMTPKGVYIIRLTDKANVTEKNIDRMIEDKKQRESIKAFLIQKFKSEYLSKLMNAEDVAFLYKKGETYSNTDTLFRVGSQEYTTVDVEKIIEKRATPEDLEKIYTNGILPERARVDIADEYFKFLVWNREAERLGIEKKPEYLKELREKKINLIMALYLSVQASKEVFISDQEIMEEYEKEKYGKYSEPANENGVVVNIPVPFEVVKDEIAVDLKKKAEYQRAEALKRQLLEKYHFTVNETELIGS
jgi:hypothetical protein